MNIPTYLEGFVKNYEETDFSQMTICSSAGNHLLEVWYYGDLFQVPGEAQPYIVATEAAPEKIIAKDPATQEEILLFDGGLHGYDALFCEEYSSEQLQNRPLKQYKLPASKLVIQLGYQIDYEEEKDQYDFDEQGNVLLLNGSSLSWEAVKRNGFDFLGLFYVDESENLIQFVDRELA